MAKHSLPSNKITHRPVDNLRWRR